MYIGLGPDGPIEGRRVAITGLGAVTCCGIGIDALWEGLVHPAISGERRVHDFDISRWVPTTKEAKATGPLRRLHHRRGGRSGHRRRRHELGVDPARAGVIFATGVGGFDTLAEQVTVYNERGARRVSPFLVPMMMATAGAAHISMRHGLRGPSETVVTACAAGTHAVGEHQRAWWPAAA